MNNYKLLRPLHTLLQTGSLTESAKRLNVTQSAMSRTLSQIRTAFNDPILIREGKQFIVSAKGKELLEQLPTLLETIDGLYDDEAFHPESCSREFVVAYTAFLSESIVPLLCKEILSHAPDASLNGQLWQEQPIQTLADSKAELVATTLDYFPENIYGKKLMDDEYVVIMSDSHPLSTAPISLEGYFSARHILVHGLREMKQYVGEQFERHNKPRSILARTPSFTSAIDLACQTDAMVTAPLHIAGEFAQKRSIAIRSLPFTLPEHSYYLLWHAKNQKDPAHRWFRDEVFLVLQHHLKAQHQVGLAKLKRALT
ncbi:LysR family transcriptional regulator [uncultured Vibrio sp.]|uniref:LysR family transcriptional regulator n=1 Tax=uncultured Vibrio sp. TaxID=114054 RepID=UPI0025FEFEC1|nr:LysR family transcriptional regulator [uncultured Vibrio sp.]